MSAKDKQIFKKTEIIVDVIGTLLFKCFIQRI